MHQETHPNSNEYFPLKGKLGAPGGFAKVFAPWIGRKYLQLGKKQAIL